MNCPLSEAEEPIRKALERLAESPRELRCYVIIEDVVVGRFVQFCTPPLPSLFFGSPRLVGSEPLIFDGTGVRGKQCYEPVQKLCDVAQGVRWAISMLGSYLPPEAELRIVEESSRVERPS